MDLSKLKESRAEHIDVPVLFDNDGKPISGFTVVGANSPQYQEADRQWKKDNVRKSARRGRGIDTKTENGADELVKLVGRRERAIADACIVGIYGFEMEGESVGLSKEVLDEIFTARPTWLSKVVTEIENEQVFTTN